MRVAIYWEQDSWGGVDTQLLELLSTWPVPDDEFVLFYNRGNAGFDRISQELEKLPYLRCVEVSSWSHIVLARRLKTVPGSAVLRYVLYVTQPITFLVMVWRLSRLFSRTGRFDLLLADNGGYPGARGNLSALLAAKRAGIGARVLLVHHEATRPAPFMGWFERCVDQVVTTAASAVVCVSYATRQSLLESRALCAETLRIRVIHNGMCPASSVHHPPPQAMALRQVLEARDELLIAVVGRVEPYKGHEDVIFALARLDPDRRRRLRLVVIGAGDDDEVARLRRLATRLLVDDRVSFVGYVPGRPVDLVAQLDLLIVATRSFEGFGLTLLEAMHVGTPVLATRVGAIPEFVDESTGRLVNPGAPQELATALDDFVSHPEAWRGRAVSARERVGKIETSMAREYRRLFVECIAAH